MHVHGGLNIFMGFNSVNILAVFLIVILHNSAMSQNLIENGDFEEYEICPKNYRATFNKEIIPNWFSPNKGTPDYFNLCGYGKVPTFFGEMIPLFGRGWIGIHSGIFNPKGMSNKGYRYREYVATKLKEPLIKDSTYIVCFFYSLAPNSPFYTDSLSVLITKNEIRRRDNYNINLTPQIKNSKKLFHDGWALFYEEFKATGGELFLVIGNFNDDKKTNYFKNDSTIKNTQFEGAYFFIDKVSLTPKHGEKCSCNEAINSDSLFSDLSHKNNSINEEKRVVLNNVNFETGSFKIKAESYKELDTLSAILLKEKDLQIEVSGHTDNIGKQADNYNLSEARAKSVMYYLISKGISKDKIIYKGFADTFPLESNSTEEGRKRNRRVEILIKPQVSNR